MRLGSRFLMVVINVKETFAVGSSQLAEKAKTQSKSLTVVHSPRFMIF